MASSSLERREASREGERERKGENGEEDEGSMTDKGKGRGGDDMDI